MDKWFEDKFEKNRLRGYTKRRLQPSFFDNFFRKFSVTNWLIIVNFLVFIIVYLLIPFFGEEKISLWIALQPNALFSGSVWTLLTSMFMHGGIGHLLFNMISLFFVGNFVEKIIGRKRFFWLYILSGIFAGIFYAGLSILFGYGIGERIFVSPNVFAVGASGAIFALLGLLAILTPFTRIFLIAGPLIAIIFQAGFTSLFPSSPFIPILNLLIGFYFIFSIFAIFSFNSSFRRLAVPLGMPLWVLPIIAIVPLVIIGMFIPLPIGNTAHLGGLLVGLGYGLYLKNKYKKKTAMIKKVFAE